LKIAKRVEDIGFYAGFVGEYQLWQKPPILGSICIPVLLTTTMPTFFQVFIGNPLEKKKQ
jgi:hypothetical protein